MSTSIIQRDLIKSMDTETLTKFIETKTEQRNDLWSAALKLQDEAGLYQRQGNDVNWELAVANRELRERPKPEPVLPDLEWTYHGTEWSAIGQDDRAYLIDVQGSASKPYELIIAENWISDHATLEEAVNEANKIHRQRGDK